MGYLNLSRREPGVKNKLQEKSREPYPFQKEAFQALDKIKAENPKGFSTMLVLPTGAGKTYTAVHWILKNYVSKGVKVLWIAHRSELLRQAAEAFWENTTKETLPDREEFKSYVISSEFGRCVHLKTRNVGADADVVIASLMSVVSSSNMQFCLDWAKGKGLKADRKLLIVFDEAHHAAARSYREIIRKFQKYIPTMDILGLTATPFRTAKHEQGSLKTIFHTGSGIAYSIDMNTLINMGILASPIHQEVKTAIDMTNYISRQDLEKIAKRNGDLTSLDEKTLEKIAKETPRNKMIVDTYLRDKKKYGKTIVFALDVANAIALNGLFGSAGVASDFVVSGLIAGLNRSASLEHNQEAIRRFKEGQLDVLINVNILTEGTDLPNVQSVFLARPTTSGILMTQMIGRGLRGAPAGGTSKTYLVYFIDEWKNLISFVSPKALMDGDDVETSGAHDRKKLMKGILKIEDIEALSKGLFEQGGALPLNVKNVIPYGVISCIYYQIHENGDSEKIHYDVMVYDETLSIYEDILKAVYNINADALLSEKEIQRMSDLIYLKCRRQLAGEKIGVSQESIFAILSTYLSFGKVPVLKKFEDRVSLADLARDVYEEGISDEGKDKLIQRVWDNNPKIAIWYEYSMYASLMRVYFKRFETVVPENPKMVVLPKEYLPIGEVKKYYPEYAEEIEAYIRENYYKDGYYFSAEPDENGNIIRSKNRADFEIDHRTPMSKNGLTVLNNLQLLTREQNIRKSDRLVKETEKTEKSRKRKIIFKDKIFVITAISEEVADVMKIRIIEMGGKVLNRATVKTNYIVVGDERGKLTKVRERAKELRTRGAKITVLKEQEFYEYFNE